MSYVSGCICWTKHLLPVHVSLPPLCETATNGVNCTMTLNNHNNGHCPQCFHCEINRLPATNTSWFTVSVPDWSHSWFVTTACVYWHGVLIPTQNKSSVHLTTDTVIKQRDRNPDIKTSEIKNKLKVWICDYSHHYPIRKLNNNFRRSMVIR